MREGLEDAGRDREVTSRGPLEKPHRVAEGADDVPIEARVPPARRRAAGEANSSRLLEPAAGRAMGEFARPYCGWLSTSAMQEVVEVVRITRIGACGPEPRRRHGSSRSQIRRRTVVTETVSRSAVSSTVSRWRDEGSEIGISQGCRSGVKLCRAAQAPARFGHDPDTNAGKRPLGAVRRQPSRRVRKARPQATQRLFPARPA
jgi:hypothetical protein